MAIVAADLKFLSSERMIDALSDSLGQASGGGFAAGPVLQDGVVGNVFPPAGPSDLVGGRRRLRLVYPAVLSNENSRALAGGVAVYRRAASSAVDLLAVSAASIATISAAAALGSVNTRNTWFAARALDHFRTPLDNGEMGSTPVGFTATLDSAGGNSVSVGVGTISPDFVVGDKVLLVPNIGTRAAWRTVTAIAGAQLTFSGPGLAGSPAGNTVIVTRYSRTPLAPVSAPALLTAGVGAGVSTVTVSAAALETRAWPVGATVATPGVLGIITQNGTPTWDSTWPGNRGGTLPAFGVGFRVLIDDPTNGAAPEVRVVQRVNYHTGQITFTTPLANAYTAGSIVSTLLDCGEWQAQVSLLPFTQQAWNRTWSDAATGPSITPRYNGVIGMNNAGGIDDRWAIVFSSSTAFNLISERSGQIAAGNTSSTFVPLNPLTSQPLMVLPGGPAAWGAGWIQGNVLRFNTRGAHSGVVYVQNISPGAAGADEGELIMRCDA